MSAWTERIAELAGEQPSLVRLAEAVSLAVRVDPPLLRKARLDCVPEADAGTEADLWRSPLVKTRSPDGFVFLPEAAEALRSRLARDSARLTLCRELTRELHQHLPPAVQLEEEIAWLSVVPGPEAAGRIEELLRSALAALVVDERRGLASWAARALPSLPSSIRASTTASMLHAGAQLRLGHRAESLRHERETPEWARWVAPADLPRVPVAVRLFPGKVELDARSPEGGARLDLPATNPLLLDLFWDTGSVQVTFRKGEIQSVSVPTQEIQLRTLLGEVYDLRQAGTAPRGLRDWIIDFSEERERHRPFFGREREIERIGILPSEAMPVEERNRGQMIVVHGEVGSGKTALLAHLIDRLTVHGIEPPHHFFRRGWPRWEDVRAAERSLIAQIVRRFPALEAVAAHQSLPEILEIVGKLEILSPGAPLVLILDSIDEIPPGINEERSPLLDILPASLPSHAIVLVSARQTLGLKLLEPVLYLSLKAQADSLAPFWRHYAGHLPPKLLIDVSDQSFGIAQMLRAWIDIREMEIPWLPSPGATLERIWDDFQQARVPERVDPIWSTLAAASGPLPEWLLTASLRVPIDLEDVAFVQRVMQEGEMALTLHEEVFRQFVSSRLDMKTAHRDLATLCLLLVRGDTAAPRAARNYAIRNAFFHFFGAEDFQQARDVLTNVNYLKARCEIGRVESVITDFATLSRKLADIDQTNLGVDFGPPGDLDPQRQVNEIRSIFQMEARRIRQYPEYLASILYTGLRSNGWSPDLIRKTLRLSGEDPPLRLTEPFPPKDLVRAVPLRHQGSVTGCTFVGSPFGAEVLSWSTDGTLRLWNQNQRNLRIFTGHTGEVTGCAVLDEKRAVSSSRDGTLRIWNLQMEGLPRVLWGHEGEVLGVLAVGSQLAVSWSADRTLRIWNLEQGRENRVLRGHQGVVTACALNIAARLLVSGSDDSTVRVWDLASGDLIRVFQGHSGPVTCVAVLDSVTVVSGSQDRTLKIWPLRGNPETLQGHRLGVLGCAVSPEGSRLASWSSDRTIRIWEPSPGPTLVTLTGHQEAVLSCAFLDGERLVSCSADRTARIWNIQAKEEIARLEGHESAVRCCAMDRTGEVMVTGSEDRNLRLWNPGTGRQRTELNGSLDEIIAFLGTPGKPDPLAVFRNGRIEMTMTARARSLFREDKGPLDGGTTAPDGHYAATWKWDPNEERARLRFWDLWEDPNIGAVMGHKAPVLACAFTPDLSRLLSASVDCTLYVWSVNPLRHDPLKILIGHEQPVSGVAVSTDGRAALSCSWDGTLRLWDLETYETLRVFTGHTDRVLACALSSNGRWAVSASADRTLRVWDLETGGTVWVLNGHTGEVTGCAFTQDGKSILSRSKDGRIGVWDLDHRKLIALAEGHTDWVNAIAVDEELGIVYSCSEDRAVRAWDLASGDPQGVVYGVSPFRSLAVVEDGAYAGDEAGNLWKLEYEVQELAYEGDSKGGEEPRRGIFLSYPRDDIEMASRLRRDLQRAGIEVWMDENLRAGVNLYREIRRNIERSLLVVALISRSSLQSPFFRWEWEFAVEISTRLSPDKPFIFLILIGDVDLNELALPEDPKDIQILHISAKERGFDEALTTILDLYRRATQPPPA